MSCLIINACPEGALTLIIDTDNPGEDELIDQKVMEKEELKDEVIKIEHFKNIVRKKSSTIYYSESSFPMKSI